MKFNQIQLTNQLTLKIISLIFSYLIWSILSQQHIATIEKNIPICFYNLNDNFEISAPENLNIKVSGTRYDLWFNESNAVHIDSSFVNEEKEYEFEIYPQHIFLRTQLNLISYKPSRIKINAKKI